MQPADLNDCEKGKRIFIIGSSPQLNELTDDQIHLLENEVTIGVNRVQYKIKPRYFVSAYPNEILLGLKKVPEATFIHIRPTLDSLFSDYKNVITIKRELFNPALGLPRFLDPNEPTLYTKFNVALASTHLALVLGAQEIIYIGIEMHNVTPHAQHYYDYDPAVLKLIFEDLREIKDYPYFNIDHSYVSYEYHLARLARPFAQLNYQPFRHENHRESFRDYFRILNDYGINIFATKKESVIFDAGAVFKPLADFFPANQHILTQAQRDSPNQLTPQREAAISNVKREIAAELLKERLSKADQSPDALIKIFSDPNVPLSQLEFEILQMNIDQARDDGNLLLADTLEKLFEIAKTNSEPLHLKNEQNNTGLNIMIETEQAEKYSQAKNINQPVIIAGMHRSGTSMITNILRLAGVYLGPDEYLLGPSPDNEKGHLENIQFLDLNERILAKLGGGWDYPPKLPPGWENWSTLDLLKEEAENLVSQFRNYPFWGWKDPRNSILVPFWSSIVPDAKYIVCIRNPIEVAKSLHKRNYFSKAAAWNLWLEYNQRLIKDLAHKEYIITQYEVWFEDPISELKRVAGFIGMPLQDELISTAIGEIAPHLRHAQATLQELVDEGVPAELLDTYWQLYQKARDLSLPFPNARLEYQQKIDSSNRINIIDEFDDQTDSLDVASPVDTISFTSDSSIENNHHIQFQEFTKRLLKENESLLFKVKELTEHLHEMEQQYSELSVQQQDKRVRLIHSKELTRELLEFIDNTLSQIYDQNLYPLEYQFIKLLLDKALNISSLSYRLPLQFIAIKYLQRLGENESKDKLLKEIKSIGTINSQISQPIQDFCIWINQIEQEYTIARELFDQIIQADDIVDAFEKNRDKSSQAMIDIIRQKAIKAEMEGDQELAKELLEFASFVARLIESEKPFLPQQQDHEHDQKNEYSPLLDFLFIDIEEENDRKPLQIEPIKPSRIITSHKEPIDIIICVHNALDDVKRCLASVITHTSEPYRIIIVDDGSDQPTHAFLQEFSKNHDHCILLYNETARGYTRAANQGIRNSQAKFFVLLNSDTIVGPDWLDGLYSTMVMDSQIGVVGPLSNTASWQSIPKLTENGDWALNPLPTGLDVDEMSRLVAKHAAKLALYVPLLNGFCLMVRREVIEQIGYLNEDVFGDGYGEEDDFNLRARKAGWKLAIADDVYIYHAQSKSYSNERRHQLAQRAGVKLRELHGDDTLNLSINLMNPNRVLEGIRARSNIMFEIEQFIQKGKDRFSGKKLLFLLPVNSVGGGANVVIDEARCMRKMGVDAQLFNVNSYREGFLNGYPHLDLPTIFGEVRDLSKLILQYDAIVATANFSVEWLKPFENLKKPVLGYYIQDYEPWMYVSDSPEAKKAYKSYTLIKNIKPFTKTNWTYQIVHKNTGINPNIVGISINIDLFRPRDLRLFGEKPIRIVAMVRAASKYRNPKLTLEILRQLAKEFNHSVLIQIFGSPDIRFMDNSVPLDFNFEQYGILTQLQVANLLSKADIFVDFSTHQAMGLTALEAMACGCAVIVPQYGGAVEFVQQEKNGVIVDTENKQSCYAGLKKLVLNDTLRKDIQLSAIHDVVQYFPEKAAYNILDCLFAENDQSMNTHIKKKKKKK